MIDKDLLLVLKSSMIGDGEPDLGEKLMNSFLTVLAESDKYPGRIICLNSAIFLTTQNSPVENILNKFIESGTEIFSCGTCLDYYKRADKLVTGQVTNMIDTVASLTNYTRVIAP